MYLMIQSLNNLSLPREELTLRVLKSYHELPYCKVACSPDPHTTGTEVSMAITSGRRPSVFGDKEPKKIGMLA